MGGGGGKGGGEKENTSGSAALEAFAKEMQEMSRPVREETFSQVLEGLQTGGIEARIPMITSAVEASRGATSGALRQIDQQNAMMGIANTAAGNRVRSEALMAGEQRTAQLPTELVQQFINNALGQITGTQQTVVQGYGGAAEAQSRMYSANTAASAQRDAAMMQMIGQMSTGAGVAYAGCWIAAELYGWFTPDWFAARHFIFERWQGRIANLVRHAYLQWGRQAALVVRHVSLVRYLVKPLFDAAVRKARE